MIADEGQKVVVVVVSEKNAVVSALLNFFIPGAGYVYSGNVGLGVAALIVSLSALFLTMGLAAFVVYPLLLIDGALAAGRANRRRPPTQEVVELTAAAARATNSSEQSVEVPWSEVFAKVSLGMGRVMLGTAVVVFALVLVYRQVSGTADPDGFRRACASLEKRCNLALKFAPADGVTDETRACNAMARHVRAGEQNYCDAGLKALEHAEQVGWLKSKTEWWDAYAEDHGLQ